MILSASLRVRYKHLNFIRRKNLKHRLFAGDRVEPVGAYILCFIKQICVDGEGQAKRAVNINVSVSAA